MPSTVPGPIKVAADFQGLISAKLSGSVSSTPKPNVMELIFLFYIEKKIRFLTKMRELLPKMFFGE